MTDDLMNWAGNHRFSAARLHTPETVEQVRELVLRCDKLKAIGTRHSFNHIADCTEDLVSLERFDKVLSLDRERQTVTVEAGIRYGHLCRTLNASGFALHNQASLPHISVAGACATATHGSGDGNGNSGHSRIRTGTRNGRWRGGGLVARTDGMRFGARSSVWADLALSPA